MIIGRDTKKRTVHGLKAQAIVEFAIALPVFLALLIGILEVGRLVFIYSAVTNASRNAARYASAVGYEQTGTYRKYIYCDGIRDLAKKSAYIVQLSNADIKIDYDSGPGTGLLVANGCDAVGGDDMDVFAKVNTGHRVTVEITTIYTPMTKLIPLGTRTIVSKNSRTILGIIDLDNK